MSQNAQRNRRSYRAPHKRERAKPAKPMRRPEPFERNMTWLHDSTLLSIVADGVTFKQIRQAFRFLSQHAIRHSPRPLNAFRFGSIQSKISASRTGAVSTISATSDAALTWRPAYRIDVTWWKDFSGKIAVHLELFHGASKNSLKLPIKRRGTFEDTHPALVADSFERSAEATRDFLRSWGLSSFIANDNMHLRICYVRSDDTMIFAEEVTHHGLAFYLFHKLVDGTVNHYGSIDIEDSKLFKRYAPFEAFKRLFCKIKNIPFEQWSPLVEEYM